MFSPALQNHLIQPRFDDQNRKAFENDRRSTYRFLRHYAEMVVVMFAGMFVLMAPAGVLLGAFDTSWSRLSPAMNVFGMALTMTVPMVAWMRYRGHTWRANIEMAASMLIPTFVVMVVLWAGAAKGTLMVPEHAGMLACMLVAMLLRRDEYSCGTHAHGDVRAAVAV
jgi:hypothetical protein